MDNIDYLYKCYEILSDAGEKITEHESEYKTILEAVKGTSKEKRLAAQFISKFYKHFPELVKTSIDAQIELCEDSDTQICSQAIKDLPKFCQNGATSEVITKISMVLAKLLAVDEQLLINHVMNSLRAILSIDIISVLNGIFQIIAKGDETARDRCFKFVLSRIIPLGASVVTKEAEDVIIEEVKKALQDVTSDEFHLCMTILGHTKLGKNVIGNAELVKLATDQADLNAEIDEISIDEDIVERFIQCATAAIHYFSSAIRSTAFVAYVCDKLFPLNTWHMIRSTDAQGQLQLKLLKIFAELCSYCDPLENADKRIEAVYLILLEYLPTPVIDENADNNSTPKFEFSHAECLLFALHNLGKKNEKSLLYAQDEQKFKDFRARLQYLARGTQGYIMKLEEALKNKSTTELATEENKLKQTALTTTKNIMILIRDLFNSSFKHNVKLSCEIRKSNKIGIKRKSSTSNSVDTTNDDDKKPKLSTEQKMYMPPSGKYSARVQNYNNNGNSNNTNNTNNKRYGSRNNSNNIGNNGGGRDGGFRRRKFNRY